MAETKARFIAGNFTTTGKPADVSGATGSSEGLIVYSTIDDLPTTNLTSGDQAFVSASSRLYISNGSGWYNVALINATPSLTVSPSGTIELSTEGVAQIVTITAADSDNADASLTLSVDSGGDFFKMATVSQDSSVFTITPRSKDSATSLGFDGTATLTFKASDGISFGTETNTFTLAFSIPNSNFTSLLIKADSAGTDNQVDASASNHTITEVGNVTSTALTPYHPGGYSTSFDGVSDYLSFTMTSAFNLTGNFTLECWFNANAITIDTQHPNIIKMGTYQLYLNSASNFVGITPDGSNITLQSANSAIALNTWYHVAVVRSGSSEAMFLNGTRVDTNTASTTYGASSGTSLIGTYTGSGGDYNGTIKDLRLVNGTAIYDPSETTISTPTEPLTAVTNTSLLTCHAPYIGDGSSTRHTIATGGNTLTKRFGPYDYDSYTKTNYGGSVYFDGSGDYLTTPTSADFAYGTGDFTIEAWVNIPSNPSNYKYILGQATVSTGLGLYIQNSVYKLYGGSNLIVQSSVGYKLNVWEHIAISRSGTTLKMFLNGAEVGSVTNSLNFASGTSNGLTIGRWLEAPDSQTWLGNIADVRVVKGTAVYTSAFTPPTAPVSAVTNTKLLTCTNKNDIWDASGKVLTKAGNTTASNTQRKFTTSSAMYFDGTGDFISSPTSQTFDLAGSIAWTIEGWFYWSSLSGEQTLVEKFTGGNGPGWTLYKLSSNALGFYSGPSTTFSNTIGTVTSGQWYHVAITRDAGGTTRGFLNGTLNASGTYSIGNNSTGNLYIGSRNGSANYMNGYVQDVRITKGLARYTSAFTPTTTEHKA